MADFPTRVFLRPPLVDGIQVPGGGLNAAVRRIQACRSEIQAVETLLSTGLRGDHSTLAARIDRRIAPNGIPIGQLYYNQKGPFSGESLRIQSGLTILASGSKVFGFQAFTAPYSTGLDASASDDNIPMVIAQIKFDSSTNPCGWVTVGKVLSYGFYYALGQRQTSYGSGTATTTVQSRLSWIALGGSA